MAINVIEKNKNDWEVLLTQYPFLQTIQPLIFQCERVILDYCAQLSIGSSLIHPNVLTESIVNYLLPQLNTLLDKTFKYALRDSSDQVQQKIDMEYPVLTRLVMQCIDQFQTAFMELLTRLDQDYHRVLLELCPQKDTTATVATIQLSMGDTHENGRSVAIIHFNNQDKVVYKPRSLHIELAWQRWLSWFESVAPSLPTLRTMKIIVSENYGWQEFVEQKNDLSAAEAEAFFTRIGVLLGLFYLIGAADLHFENMIVAGEHPMFIDLETLLHPSFNDQQEGGFNYNVTHSYVLPGRIWGNKEKRGFDLGALTGGPVERQVSFQGKRINPNDFADVIEKSFTETYQILLSHKKLLLSKSSPLNIFSGIVLRYIPKPTRTYFSLLDERNHPSLLKSEEKQVIYFQQLAKSRYHIGKQKKLLDDEIAALQKHNVPRFTALSNSRDLFLENRLHTKSFFKHTALETIQRHLRRHWGKDDLAAQQWYIRSTLQAHNGFKSDVPPFSSFHSNGDIDTLADLLLKRMLQISRFTKNRYSCGMIANLGAVEWSVQTAGIDLYDGISGIMLALSTAYQYTHHSLYATAAMGCYEEIKLSLRTASRAIQAELAAGLAGLAGVIYSLHKTIPILSISNDQLLPSVVDLLKQKINQGKAGHDWLNGAAGVLYLGSKLYQETQNVMYLELASCAHDYLMRTKVKTDSFEHWPPAQGSYFPLLGLTHGASGFALAFNAYWQVTKHTEDHAIVKNLLAFERFHFRSEEQYWPDYREKTEKQLKNAKGSENWCNGSAGIGLSRLQLKKSFADPLFDQEIQVAIRHVRSQFGNRGFSLCHGDISCLELLLSAWQTSEQYVSWDEVSELIQQTVNRLEKGYMSGLPGGYEVPTFMLGLAGTAYQLLRFSAPTKVQSVLLFE